MQYIVSIAVVLILSFYFNAIALPPQYGVAKIFSKKVKGTSVISDKVGKNIIIRENGNANRRRRSSSSSSSSGS
jgi:hypothetical protein